MRLVRPSPAKAAIPPTNSLREILFKVSPLRHSVCSSHQPNTLKLALRARGWSSSDFANHHSQSSLHLQRIDSYDRGSGTTYSERFSSDYHPFGRSRPHEYYSPEGWERHSSRVFRIQPHLPRRSQLLQRPWPY